MTINRLQVHPTSKGSGSGLKAAASKLLKTTCMTWQSASRKGKQSSYPGGTATGGSSVKTACHKHIRGILCGQGYPTISEKDRCRSRLLFQPNTTKPDSNTLDLTPDYHKHVIVIRNSGYCIISLINSVHMGKQYESIAYILLFGRLFHLKRVG